MQLFITGLSPQNGIVADLIASTGNQYSYSFYSLTIHYCFILIKILNLLLTEFLHTIFSSFAIIQSLCIVLAFVGSSIKATCSSNRHILALEANSKLFEEVLEPLKKATLVSKSRDTDISGNSFEDDEDTPIMD